MTPTSLPFGIDMGELRKLAATAAQIQRTPAPDNTDGLVPAISYLRVSTKDQATRNGLEEGLSIPAQREAAQRKADQLGAVIVKEFIEPGESAKTAQRRALQDMLDYATENPVQYCIINKVDRLARNRLDDALIHATLRDANISLVSVTENIDETPSGMLMHGILASMAEFYSLNLAQEVLKGMTQKASMGGTPAKAPLGYLNVRTTDAKGHEVRDVTIDPDRADLVKFAFTAYATGNWTLSSLATELEARGLTSRPTPARPAKPITTTALHKILTNPYYQGSVTFRGVTYDGTHSALIDTETWLRVQKQLDDKNQRGERPQKYDHYLKGTLYCSCGAKMMIERPRDKQGDRYEYFTCSGRRKKNGCTRSAIITDRIEDQIESTYNTNSLTAAEADRVREVLGTVFDQLEATTDDERSLLLTQKEKLDAERLKLVQAHYADAIPLDLLKSEQDRIRTNLDAIEHRLENLATSYEDAHEGLDQLADILTDLGDVYTRCEPAERRILNRALLDKIILDDEDHVDYVPTDAVSVTIAQARATQPPDLGTKTNLPRHQTGQVSNFSSLVVLRRSFSNPSPPLKSLISRVLRGKKPFSGRRHPSVRTDSRGPVVRDSLQSQTRLSFPIQERVIADYLDGVPMKEITARYGIHRGTVHQITRRAGVPLRPRGFPDSIRQEVAKLYSEGQTIVQVAARLGISYEGARAGIVACGVPLRPRGRQPSKR